MTFHHLTLALVSAAAAMSAQAAVVSYNVTETFLEPETQPFNSVFIGTFDYDATTHVVSNLKGQLSEAMTGGMPGAPTWLNLSNQLVSWYDPTLGGTFAATFKNSNTDTFWKGLGGDGWSPQAGVDAGATYFGFPVKGNNPGNAYALIFVPDAPLSALTPAQINKLAYADCAPGGMMGAVCMTGTSVAGYGALGTMGGYPVSQVITTAAVPEPGVGLLALAGLAVGVGSLSRRRRLAAI